MRKKRKWIVVLLFLLLFLAGAGGFILYRHMQEDSYAYDSAARNGIIKARSEEEIQRILNQQVKDGMFNVSINSHPVFKSGDSEGNLWIENVPANTCDMKIRIALKNSDKTIFETKKIRPDQNIKNAKLQVKLKKGSYPAVAEFTAYDKKSKKIVGNADVAITIEVQH